MQSLLVRGAARTAAGVLCALAIAGLAARQAAATFATFESGQVRPLAFSPDGSRLFAVNTPDDQLEIFAVSGGSASHVGSVPVGLEPVAVAVRTNGEVWVVNHLSDSVSIVDVGAATPHVIRTLLVGDEPRDVVFAGPTDGSGNFTRAFITTARRGQNLPATMPPDFTMPRTPRALVWVFDATNLGSSMAGDPTTIIPLFGDTPRALAATPDGHTVYAAIFESGNETTAVSEGAVCNGGSAAPACNLDGILVPGGLAGGKVPGGLPAPNKNVEGTTGPETGLILKFNDGAGLWEDGLGRNWQNAVRFDLPDLDVFQINAVAPTPAETASFAHVGTVLFNMLVNPSNGKLYVTNTDAENDVRFEGPGMSASTVRGNLHEARITVIDGTNVLPRHLNKHITALPLGYRTVPMPANIKDASLATPVGMALSSTGTLYVAAFGSSAIGTFSASAVENDTFTPDASTHIAVSGGGPTGLALDETHQRLYVLTRFDNAVKVIDTSSNTEIAQHPLHNPEPPEVVNGRPFLYDAHFTSSNGEASCSSCHVFADFDSLGWDLGNPDDIVRPNPNPAGPIGGGQPFHPMKGPMTTQTLRGLADHGPMHWRGDRTGGYAMPPQPLNETLAFEAFNVAFDSLLGRDEGPIPDADMAAFSQFILAISEPPNPNRDLDNVLKGQALNGQDVFLHTPATDMVAACEGCHSLDASQGFFGTGGLTTFENETQEFKVAHLNNAYQKIGMFGMPDVAQINVPSGDRLHQGDQIRGFGFLHDGSVATIFDFLHAVVFGLSDSDRANLEQFVLAFDTTFAPIVGQQVTLTDSNAAVVGARIDLMIAQAEADFTLVGQPGAKACDLVVKGIVNGEARGYLMNGTTGQFQSDRALEPTKSDSDMRTLATQTGQQLTYTCVPPGSGTRVGIDRDEDGYLDRDEIDAGSDPADPLSTPAPAAPTPTPTPASSIPLAAKKLLIKNQLPDDVSKNKILLLAKSSSIVVPAPGGPGDPRCNGDPNGTVHASLTIASATSGQSFTANLPCQNWKLIGSTTNPKGYKYTDPELADGTAKVVVWKDQSLLKASLSGKGASILAYDLQTGVTQDPVTARLTSVGGGGLCLQCSGSNGKDGSDGKMFEGKDCAAPPSCPP
jgi:YVTN family beta-propeller protein